MLAFNYFPMQTQGKKPAPSFTFLYAFKLVINTHLDTGRRKLEGIYPLWFAWGGKHCYLPCYPLQITIPPSRAKRELYETLQLMQNPYCLAPGPCLIKVSKAYTCATLIFSG